MIVSYGVIAGILVLGVWSFIALDYSLKSIETTTGNLQRFFEMAAPLQWPGWEVVGPIGAGGVKTTRRTTGFGPQAGALALGIGGVGLLAQLIGDSMEKVPNGPCRTVRSAR